MPCSERRKEIKQRRHRKSKLAQLGRRLEKARVSERALIAEKIRRLTPGAQAVLDHLGLEDK